MPHVKYFKQFIPFLVITLVTFITYWDLPNTFFQQDEWWAFGLLNKREGIGGIGHFVKDTILSSGKIHFTPLADIGFYLQYKLFQMNFSFYAFVSIFIHLLNISLVYILVGNILRNKYLAILSALLFAVNSTSHQAVSWVAASLNTQGATLFSLLFYILFLRYLKNKERNKKIITWSLLSLVIGLLFKELIAPFVLVPFLYVLYSNKTSTSAKKIFTPFVIFLFLYLLLRFIMFINAAPVFGTGNVELVQTGAPEYFYRIAILPFRVIAQSLIPTGLLLFLSENLIRLAYPQFVYPDNSVNPFVRETIGYDIVCFFVTATVFFLTFLFFSYFKKRNKVLAKGLIVLLLITVFSAALIIFVPGRAGYVSLIESRHLYSGSFGAAGLLVVMLFGLLSWISKSKSKIILILAILVITLLNIWKVKSDINELKTVGDSREYILTNIAATYPDLPQKIVIYTQSDTAYYGLAENEKILPVQVGFGWMLLTWYHKNENFPSCLYDTKLFLDIAAQGYKECDGRGFGYFRDYGKFLETIKKENLSPDEIIAYKWDSKTETFKNITKIILLELKK